MQLSVLHSLAVIKGSGTIMTATNPVSWAFKSLILHCQAQNILITVENIPLDINKSYWFWDNCIKLYRSDLTTVRILPPIISIWSTNSVHIFQISALGCPEQFPSSGCHMDADRWYSPFFLFLSHWVWLVSLKFFCKEGSPWHVKEGI